jgi:hypothetical protein
MNYAHLQKVAELKERTRHARLEETPDGVVYLHIFSARFITLQKNRASSPSADSMRHRSLRRDCITANATRATFF